MKRLNKILMVLVAVFTFCLTKDVFAEECVTSVGMQKYNVIFNTNGGNTIENMSICSTCGSSEVGKAEALAVIPTRKGYTFDGWYADSELTIKVTDWSKVNIITEKDSNGCPLDTMKVNLYAKWTANTYTITLSNQEAATAGTTKIYEKYNTGYYIDSNLSNKMTTSANPITVPVRTGYTFDGYFTTANGGTKYIDSNGKLTSAASATNFAGNGTLYAHWSINGELCLPKEGGYGYTINFNTDGGKVKNIDGEVIQKITICTTCTPTNENILLPIPTKDGYAFAGWYNDSKFSKLVTGSYIESGRAPDLENAIWVDGCYNHSTTLYAKWEEENDTNRYGTYLALVLDDNNKKYIRLKDEVVNDIANVLNELKNVELPKPEKDGYEFDGWYIDKEYKTKVNSGEDIVNILKNKGMIDAEGHAELLGYANYLDLKIYAKWNKIAKIGNTGVSQSILFTIIGGLMIIAGSTIIFRKRKTNKSSL